MKTFIYEEETEVLGTSREFLFCFGNAFLLVQETNMTLLVYAFSYVRFSWHGDELMTHASLPDFLFVTHS